MKNYVLLICFMMTAGMVSAQALKVASNGYVGVNEGDPDFPFQVSVNEGTNGIILASKDGNNPGAKFFQKIESGGYGQLFVRDADNADRIFLNSGYGSFNIGKFSVGSSSFFPEHSFHVTGTAAKSDGGTAWVVASDKRLKRNIKKFSDGLSTILQINPVVYEYNGKGGTTEGAQAVGIIAQEMQKIAPYMISTYGVENMNITDSPQGPSAKIEKSGKEYLQYDANALQYILINAIKEQQSIIENLQDQILMLSAKIDLSEIDELKNSEQDKNESDYFLGQNQPNPFKTESKIIYNVRDNDNALINIFDMQGRLAYSSEVKRSGVLDLSNIGLKVGIYSYVLSVNGAIKAQKKMIVQ